MAVETQHRPGSPPVTTSGRHRRRGWILIAVAVWNVWLWATRTINLVNDPTPRSTGFVVVHVLLYAASFAIAIGLGMLGWRMVAEARRAGQEPG